MRKREGEFNGESQKNRNGRDVIYVRTCSDLLYGQISKTTSFRFLRRAERHLFPISSFT